MERGSEFLVQASIYLAAAVLGALASHRLGLGSAAGYLVDGIAIGPRVLQLVETADHIKSFRSR